MPKQEKEFFEVVAVSKDDIRSLFKGNKKALKIIDSMTDDDMEYLARKFGDAICGDEYYNTLKIVFEDRFLSNE